MRRVVLHPIVLGVGLLLASFSAILTGQSGVALASLIATGPVQEKGSQDAQVSETLNRGLLTAKLVELGLSEQEASGRVAQLNSEAVAALVENLDKLEPGRGPSDRTLWIIGGVVLVVILLVAIK